MHGAQHYANASKSWAASEREQHRKSARIALDTSAHAGSQYLSLMRNSDDQVCLHKLPLLVEAYACFLVETSVCIAWLEVDCLLYAIQNSTSMHKA